MKRLNKSEVRIKHISNLGAIVGRELTESVYKQLKDLEHTGHRFAEDHCNGLLTEEEFDSKFEHLKSRTIELLPELKRHLVFNTDPRGAFLKIHDDHIRELRKTGRGIDTDFGGYGIICPEGV